MSYTRSIARLVLLAITFSALRAHAQDDPAGTLPAQMEPGRIYPVHATAANRGARLTILNGSVAPAYGSLKAGEGKQLLILATEWENVIPLVQVKDEQHATMYSVPTLSDHVYLVYDAARVARILPKDNGLPGHVAVKNFAVEKIGDRVRGNVIFEIPEKLPQTLDFRFYDFAHGHMFVSLKGGPAPTWTPVAAPLKSEILEVGAFAFRREPALNGKKAPEGMVYAVVDLRARSQYLIEADATAFDPKARDGKKAQVGTVADWKESRRYLQMVVDGQYGYAPVEEATKLAEIPRFLPDVMTGDEVAFLIPEKTSSVELRCDFPNAAIPGKGTIRPRGLTLALDGVRPRLEPAKGAISISDDVFRVFVTKQAVAETFAGQKAESGGRFVVLDVTVTNSGGKGEFFQTNEQLKYAAENGAQHPPAAATYAGVYRPAPLVWIPPSDRRSFQVALDVPPRETKPRLSYTGLTMAKVYDLHPLAAVAVDPNAKPANVDKPPQMAKVDVPATPVDPNTKPLKTDVSVAKPLRVSAKSDKTPRGLAGVGLTQEQVNQAIDKGADALWAHVRAEQKKSGRAFGEERQDVLTALSLVHANLHKRDASFDAAIRAYLGRAKVPDDLLSNTYQTGLFCMLIEAYGDSAHLPKLRAATRWLLENQGPAGSWGYGVSIDPAFFKENVPDRVLVASGFRPLAGPGADGEAMERKGGLKSGGDGDTSVSQYALLGLHSASKLGIKPPAPLWQKALAAHLKRQNADGGWAYDHAGQGSYGSMTAAGVCAVALARHELGEKSPGDHEAIERGLAWLNANFSVTRNPPNEGWHYYFLYSLERVGRILDTEFIGDHEWYPLGAAELVRNQSKTGLWVGKSHEEDPRIASPFALLFLTRATANLNAKPPRGGEGAVATRIVTPPGVKVHIILDCSGSMLEEMGGRTKFDIARDAVRALIDTLPDSAEVGLRAYGHRKRAIEEGASDDTQLVIPMARLDRKKFLDTLADLRCKGKTPLAKSLLDAKGDVRGGTAAEPVTVILLTDGGEDTQPRRDPLAAAAEFGKLGGVNLQVVGFDINREDWTAQLQGIAGRGNGMYLPASRADILIKSLKTAVFRTPESFTVFDSAGKPVFGGAFGDGKKLPEGQYVLRADYGGRRFEESFWVNTRGTTTVTFYAQKVTNDAGAPIPVGDAPAVTHGQQMPKAAPPATQVQATPKFCTECGKPLAGGAKFCTNCGAKVTAKTN
ncbi:MAG: VWA domain-containing protein [Phycisphaerae bacterium]